MFYDHFPIELPALFTCDWLGARLGALAPLASFGFTLLVMVNCERFLPMRLTVAAAVWILPTFGRLPDAIVTGGATLADLKQFILSFIQRIREMIHLSYVDGPGLRMPAAPCNGTVAFWRWVIFWTTAGGSCDCTAVGRRWVIFWGDGFGPVGFAAAIEISHFVNKLVKWHHKMRMIWLKTPWMPTFILVVQLLLLLQHIDVIIINLQEVQCSNHFLFQVDRHENLAEVEQFNDLLDDFVAHVWQANWKMSNDVSIRAQESIESHKII